MNHCLCRVFFFSPCLLLFVLCVVCLLSFREKNEKEKAAATLKEFFLSSVSLLCVTCLAAQPTHPWRWILLWNCFSCSGQAVRVRFTWTRPGEPATCCDTPTNLLICDLWHTWQTGERPLCILMVHLVRQQHLSLVCTASPPAPQSARGLGLQGGLCAWTYLIPRNDLYLMLSTEE